MHYEKCCALIKVSFWNNLDVYSFQHLLDKVLLIANIHKKC